MRQACRCLFAILLLCLAAQTLTTQAQETAKSAVAATIETSLKSASGQIRQFAFDGDGDTFFLSARNVKSSDHFTLLFDKPVTVNSIVVTTGRPKGGDRLDAGALEGSDDGKTFEPLAPFREGSAKYAKSRIKPAEETKQPLAIREIVITSEPAVTVFKYPIEVVVEVSDAPDMKKWADQVARLCERQFPMICDELKSPGFKPRTLITMTMKKDYKGVAMAGGGRITGSVNFFKKHPEDMGAMIHETVHCVQAYRAPGNPGWLVEGIADYIRFFKYEPDKLGKINPRTARYDGSYRVSAAFLAYVSAKYDAQLVNKLNKTMREGEYTVGIWKILTKKTIDELDQEWRASLQR
jgi:hypothetical protein